MRAHWQILREALVADAPDAQELSETLVVSSDEINCGNTQESSLSEQGAWRSGTILPNQPGFRQRILEFAPNPLI